MKLRRIVSFVLPSLLAASFAIACGKDNPPAAPSTENAPLVLPGTETATEEAKAGEPKAEEGEAKKEGDEVADGSKDPSELRDAKSRRTARDRMNGRRPALRHPREPRAEGAGENGEGLPVGEGMPSEPTKIVEGTPSPTPVEPTTNPTTPTPATNPSEATPTPATNPTQVAEHPIGEPTPAAPNPATNPAATNPTPTDTVVAEAGSEIHSAMSIDASTIMPSSKVAEILGMQLVAGAPLQGIAVVPGYGSIIYAMQDAAKFGVALQVWQDASKRECDDRYRRMRLQYPNAEDVAVLTPSKAFYSYFDKLQTLTWLEPTKRMVVSVTCGETVCNQDQLVRLAKSARERLP